jgi:AcrR family transcriptional regulator
LAPATVEWYPLGRLVLWSAIIGTLIVVVAIPNFGTDKESFQAGLRSAFEHAIQSQAAPDLRAGSGGHDFERLIDLLVLAIPPAAAVLATLVNVFNLWLAARIVKVSGRLRRPWPDLAELQLPGYAAGVLAAAIAGAFLPGLIGLLASVLAASVLMAYAIQGFAVLHAITRNLGSRGVALGGAYATVIVFGWPVLGMSLLGLADAFFNVRARVAAKRGPPSLRA